MTLHLYDTAHHELREFVPLVAGQAGIYVCGATPQSGPHIGHMRSQVNFDVLRRWLIRSGYAVTYIRNVTDIEDKILAKSAESGESWWAVSYRCRVTAPGYPGSAWSPGWTTVVVSRARPRWSG